MKFFWPSWARKSAFDSPRGRGSYDNQPARVLRSDYFDSATYGEAQATATDRHGNCGYRSGRALSPRCARAASGLPPSVRPKRAESIYGARRLWQGKHGYLSAECRIIAQCCESAYRAQAARVIRPARGEADTGPAPNA